MKNKPLRDEILGETCLLSPDYFQFCPLKHVQKRLFPTQSGLKLFADEEGRE